MIKNSRFTINEADGIPSTSDMEARKNAFINYIYETLRYTAPSVTLGLLQNGTRVEDNSVFIVVPFQKGNGWYEFEEYLRAIEAYLEPSGMWASPIVTPSDSEIQWRLEQTRLGGCPNKQLLYPTLQRCRQIKRLERWRLSAVFLRLSSTMTMLSNMSVSKQRLLKGREQFQQCVRWDAIT